MTKYTFKIQKRTLVEQEGSDARITSPEVFEDSTQKNLSLVDVDVAIYLDDVVQTTVTLGDSETDLSFTADLSVGEHTIRIVPQKDPIVATDVMVNQFLIDDEVAVATQYDFNNKIYGTESTLRQLLALPHLPGSPKNHNKVWYGSTISTLDSTLNLSGFFYRPCIVSDKQSEWVLTVNKTSNGILWFHNPEDKDSIMYDSTLSYQYYFCREEDIAYDNPDNDYILMKQDYDDDPTLIDSSTILFRGAGTYDEMLYFVDESLDTAMESSNRIVAFSASEFNQLEYARWYHLNYSVNPFLVS